MALSLTNRLCGSELSVTKLINGRTLMTTATVPSTDALQQIGELQQRATELKTNFETEFGKIMQEISALATGEQVAAVATATASAGPRPKGRTATASPATATPPKRGRASTPSKKAGKPAAAAGPVKPQDRNYSNDMSLKEAVFDVLDRQNWDGILDLPKDTFSLSAGEIKKVIEQEGKWVSSSDDIGSQLQGALGSLRKMMCGEGKDAIALVVRENGRYYVPEGAEYPKA